MAPHRRSRDVYPLSPAPRRWLFSIPKSSLLLPALRATCRFPSLHFSISFSLSLLLEFNSFFIFFFIRADSVFLFGDDAREVLVKGCALAGASCVQWARRERGKLTGIYGVFRGGLIGFSCFSQYFLNGSVSFLPRRRIILDEKRGSFEKEVNL